MSAIDTALAELEGQIGQEIGVSDWITVDQAMIDQFAVTTQDEQWIHIDPERAAKETPFGGSIAHGFLTLSLSSQFAYQVLGETPGQVMGVNYGLNKLRFLTPVRAGARVRGRFVLKSVSKRRPNELLRENTLTVEIEGSESPALIADWLGLTIFAPS